MKSTKYELKNLEIIELVNQNVKNTIDLTNELDPNKIAMQAILRVYVDIDKILFEKHNTTKEYSCGFKDIYVKINDIDVKIKRRYYRNHKTKEYKFFLDDFLELKSRKEQSYELIINNFQEIINARSYKEVSKNLLQNLDPRLISDAISKVTFAIEMNKLIDGVETLFIAMDGQWFGAKKQRGRKNEFKFAVAWTGTKEISKNRFKLLNRQILCLNKIKDSQAIADHIDHFIYKVYGKVKEVIVIGDGASWITNVANNMTHKTIRVINKYHYQKMISKLLRIVKDKYFKFRLPNILNMNKNKFENYLLTQIVDKDGVILNWNNISKALFNRIIKWFSKYKKNLELLNAINPIECIQSHYFAKYFRGQRVFKLKNLYKYMNLQCAYLNGWKIKFGVGNNYSWMGWDSEYQNWNEPQNSDYFQINYDSEDPPGIKRSSIKVEDPEGYGFGGRY